MSSATVTNTFQAQTGPIPLSQLDTNFSDLVSYLNNPLNRNNFAVDSGTTNTIALSFNPSVSGYTRGLEITFKAAATNTGSVAVNIGSLGVRGILNQDLTSLQSGQVQANSIYKAVDDGTRFIFIGFPSPASQTDMQTATVVAAYVTPAQVQNNRGVAKAGATFV